MSYCSMEGHMKPLPCLKRLSIMLPVLLLLAGPSAVKAQTITGLVEDGQTGTPLASVQLFIATLDIGVLSESNGRYALQNLPAGTHEVSAARIGYQTVVLEVTVAAGATVNLNFNLIRQALGLDEIIVTGTAGGTQRRAIGNVVSQIDAAALAEVAPATNMEQLLGTRVAGVTLVPGTGTVGYDTQSIRIRGSSSAALTNDPIVYIDGVRMNSLAPELGGGYGVRESRLNDINPDDIESIEIIKGPAAATLYGTEASNGVIQIITKRGVAGAPSFDASVEYGFSWLPDPAGKVDEFFGIVPETGEVISMNLYEQEQIRTGEPLHQYGPLTNYNLSVRGGTDLIRYFASLNRQDQEGIIDWNTDQRQTGRLNLGLTASEVLDIDFNMSFTERTTTPDDNWWIALNWGNPITAADVGGREDPQRGFRSQPPEAKRDFHEIRDETDRRTASVTLSFIPRDWFRHRLVTGVDVSHHRGINFYPLDTEFQWYGRRGRTGEKTTNISETRLISFDYGASATSRLMDDRLGSVTSVGLQYYNRLFTDAELTGTGFATPSLSTVGAAAVTEAGEDIIENATVGLYVQQQFDWNERIFITGAIRGDDNSAFGTDYSAAIYPKVSATWVMSEEGFWNPDLVNEFRVRGAWGAAGQQPDTFAAARLYGAQSGPGDEPILTPTDFGNADLAPERGEELELGFDASLWNDRVGMNFTAYWRTTKDAIVEQPLPPSITFPSDQLVNIGEIKNWGTETELSVQVLTEDPLRWDLAVTFATLDNEITDLGGVESIPVRRGRHHIEGYPLASVFSEKVVSAEFVSGNRGAVTNILCDGGRGPDGRSLGGPSVDCADAPLLFFGRTEPTWVTTVASTLTLFTDWTLYAQVDARGGGHVNFNDEIGAATTTFRSTRCAAFLDDLMCLAQRTVRRTLIGLADAGFARIRELSLRYTVPQRLADSLRLDRASVTLGWRNVALLWFPGKEVGKYADMKYRERLPDPELNLPSEGFAGESIGHIPPLSSMTLTTRFTF